VDDQYRGMEPLQPFFEATARVQLPMEQQVTVDQMVGYAASWSAYTTFRKQHPDRPDPLDAFRSQLVAAVQGAAPGSTLTLTRTLTLLMGKGPKKV